MFPMDLSRFVLVDRRAGIPLEDEEEDEEEDEDEDDTDEVDDMAVFLSHVVLITATPSCPLEGGLVCWGWWRRIFPSFAWCALYSNWVVTDVGTGGLGWD